MNDPQSGRAATGPRNERGRKTVRKLLEAAAQDSASALHEGDTGITARRESRLQLTTISKQGELFAPSSRHEQRHRSHVAGRGGAPDGSRPSGSASRLSPSPENTRALKDHREGSSSAEDEYRALTDLRQRLSAGLARPGRAADRRGAEASSRALNRDERLSRHAYALNGHGPGEVADRAIDLVPRACAKDARGPARLLASVPRDPAGRWRMRDGRKLTTRIRRPGRRVAALLAERGIRAKGGWRC